MAADEIAKACEEVERLASGQVDPPQDAGDHGPQDGEPTDPDEDGRDGREPRGVTLDIHGFHPH